eukprot:197929-Hanusia_phi.AAC.10
MSKEEAERGQGEKKARARSEKWRDRRRGRRRDRRWDGRSTEARGGRKCCASKLHRESALRKQQGRNQKDGGGGGGVGLDQYRCFDKHIHGVIEWEIGMERGRGNCDKGVGVVQVWVPCHNRGVGLSRWGNQVVTTPIEGGGKYYLGVGSKLQQGGGGGLWLPQEGWGGRGIGTRRRGRGCDNG